MLEHSLRRRIMDELDKRPGLHKRRLAERVDADLRKLDYHLRKLQKAGLAVTRPGAREGEVLVFRAEDADRWDNERTRVLYGRAGTRKVALYVAEHPGATTREIAEVVGVTPSTVRQHLQTLREHDLLATLQIGRSNEAHPSNELQAWARTTGKHYQHPGRDEDATGNEDGNGTAGDAGTGTGTGAGKS